MEDDIKVIEFNKKSEIMELTNKRFGLGKIKQFNKIYKSFSVIKYKEQNP